MRVGGILGWDTTQYTPKRTQDHLTGEYRTWYRKSMETTPAPYLTVPGRGYHYRFNGFVIRAKHPYGRPDESVCWTKPYAPHESPRMMSPAMRGEVRERAFHYKSRKQALRDLKAIRAQSPGAMIVEEWVEVWGSPSISKF